MDDKTTAANISYLASSVAVFFGMHLSLRPELSGLTGNPPAIRNNSIGVR